MSSRLYSTQAERTLATLLAASGAGQGFVWRGDWAVGTAYVSYDVVQDRGSGWVCILGHTGHEPPNATYWQLIVGFDPTITVVTSAATSYSNAGGTGDRQSLIAVTKSPNLDLTSLTAYMVDGYTPAGGHQFLGQPVLNEWVVFDFGLEASKIITEAKLYQQNGHDTGVWQWQGSNDNSTWANIGATFAWNGGQITTVTTLSANTTGYRYYRMLGVSGSTVENDQFAEAEFKIADVTGNRYVGINNATPGGVLSRKAYGNGADVTDEVLDILGNPIWRILDNRKIGAFDAAPAAQQAHISDPAGGGTVDAEARAAIAAILDVLDVFGWTAAS